MAGFMHKFGFAMVCMCLLVTACGDSADQSKPTQGTLTIKPAAVNPPAAPVKPEPQAMRLADYEWTATEGSTSQGKEADGATKLVKDGILSVVAFNNPVAVGDTVTVKTKITGPAGRKVRVFAMRHCEAVDETDATALEFEMTGSPVPVEVSHTYQKPYSCTRMSVYPVDRLPIDLTLDGLQFFKTAAAS